MLHIYKNIIYISLTFLVILFSALTAGADTIFLKNGNSLEGFIKSEDAERVELDLGFGSITFYKNTVKRIYRSDNSESALIYKKWEEKRKEIEEQRKEAETASSGVLVKSERKISVSSRQITLQREGGQIIVDTLLGGRVWAKLYLDTGASLVVLTDKIARELRLNPEKIKEDIQLQAADGRMVKAKYVLLKSVSVQGVKIDNVEAAILPEEVKDPKLKDGLLGMSFLRNFNVQIDQEKNRLVLEKIK